MKTVLLVEDHPGTIFMYQDKLGKVCNLIIAENYADFTEKLLLHNPSLVVSDFEFPGSDGNMVASMSKSAGIPCILQSGAPELACEELFTKVFHKSEFSKVIKYVKEFIK